MAEDNVPWPLPSAWKWGTIADVAEVASNLVEPSDVPELPHIAPNHIESGRPQLLPYLTVKEDGVTSPKHRFFPGQILYSKIRPYLRKAVVVDFDGVCSADMYPLNARCDPYYLLWWLLSPGFNDLAMEHQGRTVLPKINQEALYRIPVPIPPDAEQRRIASGLNASFERSERVGEELKRVPRLVERYKQAILASAFQGVLTGDWRASHPDTAFSLRASEPQISTSRRKRREDARPPRFDPPYEVPPTWQWAPLPKLGALDRGRSRHRPRNATHLYDGPYPFVQTGDIRAARGRVTTFTQTYSEEGLAQSRLWPKGTLCITIAANIAETAILGIDACFPDSIVGFIPNENICNPHFVEFFIRTVKADLAAFAPSTAQKNINLETLSLVHVPCPPLLEQDQIVDRIEGLFAHIDRAAAEAARATELLDRLDQATLSKAFRGELVSTECEHVGGQAAAE